MLRYKGLLKDKQFMSGLYALTLVTALLVLALVIKGPEESGTLIAGSDGHITGIRRNSLKHSERYDLILEISDAGETLQRDVTLNLQADSGTNSVNGLNEADSREAQLDAAIDNMISEIEYSKNKKIKLPDALPDGTAITWTGIAKGPGPYVVLIPLMYLLLVALMAVGRVREQDDTAATRKDILRGLPRFCNQLFLMMNAGLILSDAFDTIADSYKAYNEESMTPFERDIAGLREATCGHRISTSQVINEYAVRQDVKELIRIAAILTENEKRGSDVVESLARESKYLWDERKIIAKEYSKSIDTRMSYPLGLLLILLIVITMAPALLNM